MKYFNSAFLKKNLDPSRSCTKLTVLKATTICRKIFLSCRTDNKEENALRSGNESLSWLSIKSTKGIKAEAVVQKIVATIEAKPLYYKCVREIYTDLVLIFPTKEIHLFGSSVSNLALENADVDIGMHYTGKKKLPTFLWIVRKQLLSSKVFHTVNAIFARVPILKCVHINELSCDISFSEHFGSYDSNLIKFILGIDTRIRPLILILKFLVKKKELLPNTHCLVVLAIFFLQSLEDPLIPPISNLQNLAGNRTTFKGWDVSFEEVNFMRAVKNRFSVVELLHKFFQFYAEFEFPLHVISVFMGECYLKSSFSNTDSLPEQFQCYKNNVAKNEALKLKCDSPMCIQGIFDHGNNISKNINKKQIEEFQKFCSIISVIGEDLLHGSEKHEIQFLIELFNRKNN